MRFEPFEDHLSHPENYAAPELGTVNSTDQGAFTSFFLGGFESSTHRRSDGRRLDLLAATGHDRLLVEDYQMLAQQGISTVRDAARWHLIETSPHSYDWSSVIPMLHAARGCGTQVIWICVITAGLTTSISGPRLSSN